MNYQEFFHGGRLYSCEVELMLCRQIESGERPPAQACREYSLGQTFLVKRLHSNLDYRPPVEFERDFYASQVKI
jgi:hypothetical protein